jgi:hypothetical protein
METLDSETDEGERGGAGTEEGEYTRQELNL